MNILMKQQAVLVEQTTIQHVQLFANGILEFINPLQYKRTLTTDRHQ